VSAEKIREIELASRPLLHANRRLAELEGRIDLEALVDDEPLAVVVIDARGVKPELGIARAGPSRIACEYIDVARLQRRKAIFGCQRDELNLVGVVEDRCRDGATIVGIKAGPIALRIRQTKAGKLAVRPAVEGAPRLDAIERRGQ
jgi:hypothetical protein